MGYIEPSKGEMPEVEDGLHNVIVRDVKEVTVEQDQFGNFEKVQLTIEFEDVVQPDGSPVTLDPRCNAKWNERATLYKWNLAFNCGGNPDSRFNLDAFKGKRARALIEVPRNEEGEQTGWPRVKEFLKSSRTTAAPDGKASAPSQKATAPVAEAPSDELPMPEWWEHVRSQGFSREEVYAKCQEMFGAEPHQVEGGERVSLYQELIGQHA